MKITFLLFAFLVFTPPAISKPLSKEKIQLLKELRTKIRGWAKTCPDGSMTDGPCPFADMTIFAGLLCLSGEKERCNDVKNAQSSTGEWFRSPGLKDMPMPGGGPTFSRDQTRGVLAYLVATNDNAAAERWMDHLEKSDYKRLCQKSKSGSGACDIRGTWWLETTRVWDFLKLCRRGGMRDSSLFLDTLYRPLEAQFQPADYPMHLTAAGIYIRKEIEKRTGKQDANAKDMEKVVDILYERWPYNPFMSYLKFGPNEAAANTVLKHCPPTAPKLKNGKRIGQWIWQRDKSDKLFDNHKDRTELSWDYPGGHDCIFMINLLIGEG